MYDMEEFLKYSISDEVEYNDEYSDKLDYIAKNTETLNNLMRVIKVNKLSFNKRDIMAVIGLLQDLLSRDAYLDNLYLTILELMYKEYCYDWSISPRFARLMIKIKGEDITVFQDITEITDENSITSVSISVCSLYSNYPNFEGIPESIISRFLEKIYACLINHKGCNDLRHAIATNLLPILKNKDYDGYYSKFQSEGLE